LEALEVVSATVGDGAVGAAVALLVLVALVVALEAAVGCAPRGPQSKQSVP